MKQEFREVTFRISYFVCFIYLALFGSFKFVIFDDNVPSYLLNIYKTHFFQIIFPLFWLSFGNLLDHP